VRHIFFALTISLISQLGDLFISFFKRKVKIKDTGNILPGHGGILDRLDGIVFALPFSYFLLGFFK
jgi:phosphatidate cytidylyltransferase